MRTKMELTEKERIAHAHVGVDFGPFAPLVARYVTAEPTLIPQKEIKQSDQNAL